MLGRLSLLPFAALMLAAGAQAQTVLLVPEDFATIQEAVNAASLGDTVRISPGIYSEAVAVTGKHGVTIVGSGKVLLEAGPGNVALTLTGCLAVTVTKIRTSGGSYGMHLVDSSLCTVEKCFIDQAGSDGLRVDGGGGNSLLRNVVTGAGGAAISLAGGSEVPTSGNYIAHCKLIEPAGDGVLANGFMNGAHFCTILDAGGHGFEVDGTTPSRAYVTHSRIVRPAGFGFVLRGKAGASRNTVIEANGGGALLVDAPEGFVSRCRFVRPGGNGIHSTSDDVWLKHNRVIEPLLDGFRSSGQDARVQHNRVIEPHLDGYRVSGQDALVEHNWVRDAAVRGFSIDSLDSHYRHNRSKGAGSDGFLLEGMGNKLRYNVGKGSQGFDLNNPVPGDNTADGTNKFGTVGP